MDGGYWALVASDRAARTGQKRLSSYATATAGLALIADAGGTKPDSGGGVGRVAEIVLNKYLQGGLATSRRRNLKKNPAECRFEPAAIVLRGNHRVDPDGTSLGRSVL
jgi:hypothetical protein